MARDYRKEYDNYQGTSKQKKQRAERNTARRQAEKAGTVSKGDNLDVHHKKPLSKGGSNAKSNRAVVSASTNRSFARTRTGAMKSGK